MANILVVGAAGGVGRALLSRMGSKHRVFATSRSLDRLQSVSEAHSVEGEILDARDFEQCKRVCAVASEKLGSLDGLVNLSGSILLKPAHLTSEAEWSDVIDTNLRTSFALVRAAAPILGVPSGAQAVGGSALVDAKKGGSIVLVSTAAARIGLANHDAIAAAKAGVIGLMQASAATYARSNVRINVVAPGLTDTPLAAKIVGNESSRKASESMHALGRIGKADDVAAMIEFLIDPANDWITGQVFGVDGGLGSLRSR